jgi:hypothetical protein
MPNSSSHISDDPSVRHHFENKKKLSNQKAKVQISLHQLITTFALTFTEFMMEMNYKIIQKFIYVIYTHVYMNL